MKFSLLFIAVLPLLIACSSSESASPNSLSGQTATDAPARRWYAFQHVSRGGKVYQENCAACHGMTGGGGVNWRQSGPDGKYPPSPLNGTGHAWHHPLKVLFHVVKNGSPGGQGNMPAWKEKLSDEDMIAVIAWFQSKWPDQIYAAWSQREIASRGKTKAER